MTNFKLQYRPQEPNHWWGGIVPNELNYQESTLLTPLCYSEALQLAIYAFKPIAYCFSIDYFRSATCQECK